IGLFFFDRPYDRTITLFRGCLETANQFRIGSHPQRRGAPDCRLALHLVDFGREPLQLLARLRIQRQNPRSVLYSNRPQPLQLAPDVSPASCGVARNTVSDEEPHLRSLPRPMYETRDKSSIQSLP